MPMLLYARNGSNLYMKESEYAGPDGTSISQLMTSGMLSNTTTAFSDNKTTSPCMNLSSCDSFHLNISKTIIVFAVLAFVENFLLVVAMVTWKLIKSCKMFWFLCHLSVADGILTIPFIFFHSRTLSLCPIAYGCQPTYMIENASLLIGFFVPITASHLFILAATADRFIAIKWSLRYNSIVTTKGCRFAAAAIWCTSFAVPLITALCILLWNAPSAYSALVITTSSICLTCAAGVVGLNLWMIAFAWSSLKYAPRLASGRHRRSTGSIMPDIEFFQDLLKLTITLSLFVCSFVLSCAPWSIALIVCEEVARCAIKRDVDYTLVLVLFHAIAIPVLYGFRVEVIKTRVVGYWKHLLQRLSCYELRNAS